MEEPYSYFIRPSTIVGAKDCSEMPTIWPDTWGRMLFFTGEKPSLFQKRIKTLHKGYLPIVQCSETRDEILYSVHAFGATLTGNPEDPLVMFVKLSAKNTSDKKEKASFWAGTVYDPEKFNPHREYRMENGLATEDNEVLYIYNENEISKKYTALDTPYEGPATAEQASVIPSALICLARFDWQLNPGQSKSAILKVLLGSPNGPHTRIQLEKNKEFAEQIKKAQYQEYFNRTVKFWDDLLAKGTQFYIPHKKTLDTLQTSLVYQLVGRNKVGDEYIFTDSVVQYPMFWFRSAITSQRSYDLYGYPDFARQCIRYIQDKVWVNPTTVVKSREGARHPDVNDRHDINKHGQRLWNYCEHFLFTNDRKFAKEVMPEVYGLINWMEQVIAMDDELGIIPRCSLNDNEWVTNGHRPGDDFWALAGLRAAREMGKRLGNKKLVRQTSRVIDKFHPALLAAIDKVMKEAGYIPGTFDKGTSIYQDGWGEDRDNQLMVWPSGALRPHHPAVTATLKVMRSKFREGISGDYCDRPKAMFHYRNLWAMQQHLTRGDQELVVKDLYAQLAHTGSTHGGFEIANKSRNSIETHGWFWSRYIALIRNMLLREDWDETLHILSAVPAEWAKVGNKIGVKNAPTHYGKFSFTETIREDGADIKFKANYHVPPKALILHLPYFAEVSKIEVDGKEKEIEGTSVRLPVNTKQVKLFWKIKPDTMQLTYAGYLKQFRKTLQPVRVPIRRFPSKQVCQGLWGKMVLISKAVTPIRWCIIGPFDNPGMVVAEKKGFDTVYPPEKEINLNAEYKGKDGLTVKWQGPIPAEFGKEYIKTPGYASRFVVQNPDGTFKDVVPSAIINFLDLIKPNYDAVAYAYTNIFSPKTQRVKFLMGSDDTITVWLNKVEVHANNVYRAVKPDSDQVEVTLNKGWNSVLVKICQGGGQWGFSLLITDLKGNLLTNLKYEPKIK